MKPPASQHTDLRFGLLADILTVLGFGLGIVVAIVSTDPAVRGVGICVAGVGAGALVLLYGPWRDPGRMAWSTVFIVAAILGFGVYLASVDNAPSDDSADEGTESTSSAESGDPTTDDVDAADPEAPEGKQCFTNVVGSYELIYQVPGRVPSINLIGSDGTTESVVGRDPGSAGPFLVSVDADLVTLELRDGSEANDPIVQTVAGTVRHPAVTADGSKVVAVQETSEGTRLILWQVQEALVDVLFDPADEVSQPTLSDDGTVVAWVEGPQAEPIVKVGSVNGSSVVEIARFSGTEPSLDPKGSAVAFTTTFGDGRAVHVADVAGGSSRRLSSPGSETDSSPNWVSGCDAVSFLRHGDDSRDVRIVTTAGDETSLVVVPGQPTDMSLVAVG